jgi:CRISPR-associated protein Csm3
MANLNLYGRVIITGQIRALSGLHIGGSTTALEIGALDLPVIRNQVNGQPYIPGSSLKGKMRSLSEKLTGAPQNRNIGGIKIHIAGGDARDYKSKEEYIRVGQEQYETYWVNPVFGVPSEIGFEISGPTRLVVRDIPLQPASLEEARGRLDLPYTEVKWENALDRVTSAAVPRQIERVPAGAVFEPMELVFSLFEAADAGRLEHVFTALQLVEDDYLGGQGTRGSGKVAFEAITLTAKVGAAYKQGETKAVGSLAGLSDEDKQGLVSWAQSQFFSNGAG